MLYEKNPSGTNSREKMLLFDLGYTYPSYIFLVPSEIAVIFVRKKEYF